MTQIEFEVREQQRFEEEIESIIDHKGIAAMLNAMANICHEKAQHIRENWQDDETAKVWDKNGSKINFPIFGGSKINFPIFGNISAKIGKMMKPRKYGIRTARKSPKSF